MSFVLLPLMRLPFVLGLYLGAESESESTTMIFGLNFDNDVDRVLLFIPEFGLEFV